MFIQDIIVYVDIEIILCICVVVYNIGYVGVMLKLFRRLKIGSGI